MSVLETERAVIRPLLKVEPGAGPYPYFTAACFGGRNWSLAPLQERGDETKDPTLASDVSQALLGLGAQEVLAPNPTKFNARIINSSSLQRSIPLPGLTLWRQQDTPADGTFLQTGQAGIFSAGGCSVIVATWREEGKLAPQEALIFAHAGRDCLLDRRRVESQYKEHGREHESVVNAIVQAFALRGMSSMRELGNLHVWIFWAIKPDDFVHKLKPERQEHREYNRGLPDYLLRFLRWDNTIFWTNGDGDVCLDTARLARAQFIASGVPPANVHLEHAYLPDTLPHTRKGDGKGRYLVAVARHS